MINPDDLFGPDPSWDDDPNDDDGDEGIQPFDTPWAEPPAIPPGSGSLDDIAARILASIAALPLEEQAPAIHALIGSALSTMPLETVLEMRAEIVDQFVADGEDTPQIVRTTLDLIDGHMALREMRLGEDDAGGLDGADEEAA